MSKEDAMARIRARARELPEGDRILDATEALRLGYRSPGRREMAKQLAGKRWQPKVYPMRGHVPREFEEDKQLYELFQESKRLEASLPETQDEFNLCINKLRVRANELLKTGPAVPAGEPST